MRRILLVLMVLVLSACERAAATSSSAAMETLPAAGAQPAGTAAPVFSPQPTQTPRPSATATALPTDTAVPTATALPSATPTPMPVMMIGAGDIAFCGEPYLMDEATANIIDKYPEAVVFTAGDNVQGEGRMPEYTNCFTASWGRFLNRLHPVPGNHDYMTEGGAPYYTYFGAAAGEPFKGWYSYDVGEWHIVALNSNCDAVACGPNSAQVAWLREDLAANPARCTMLHWHHPRWSSGLAGSYGSVNSFWRAAVDFGAELVINGHDHNYERFAPMDVEGSPSPVGVRQFTVGTGGDPLRAFGEIKPNSEFRFNENHGVIRLELYPDRYTWAFESIDGAIVDSGEEACH